MALAKHHTTNLETIQKAAEEDNLAVVECRKKSTGETVAMLCAVGFDGEEYCITPFAEMVDGNPFELYEPPNPEGGFQA